MAILDSYSSRCFDDEASVGDERVVIRRKRVMRSGGWIVEVMVWALHRARCEMDGSFLTVDY